MYLLLFHHNSSFCVVSLLFTITTSFPLFQLFHCTYFLCIAFLPKDCTIIFYVAHMLFLIPCAYFSIVSTCPSFVASSIKWLILSFFTCFHCSLFLNHLLHFLILCSVYLCRFFFSFFLCHMWRLAMHFMCLPSWHFFCFFCFFFFGDFMLHFILNCACFFIVLSTTIKTFINLFFLLLFFCVHLFVSLILFIFVYLLFASYCEILVFFHVMTLHN